MRSPHVFIVHFRKVGMHYVPVKEHLFGQDDGTSYTFGLLWLDVAWKGLLAASDYLVSFVQISLTLELFSA